jgi:hypothetical protein
MLLRGNLSATGQSHRASWHLPPQICTCAAVDPLPHFAVINFLGDCPGRSRSRRRWSTNTTDLQSFFDVASPLETEDDALFVGQTGGAGAGGGMETEREMRFRLFSRAPRMFPVSMCPAAAWPLFSILGFPSSISFACICCAHIVRLLLNIDFSLERMLALGQAERARLRMLYGCMSCGIVHTVQYSKSCRGLGVRNVSKRQVGGKTSPRGGGGLGRGPTFAPRFGAG